MELVPLTGDPRIDGRPRPQPRPATESGTPLPRDAWLPSTARPEPQAAPDVRVQPEESGPGHEAPLAAPAKPGPSSSPAILSMDEGTGYVPSSPPPSPPARVAGNGSAPVVLQEGEDLTRPLTLEDLQARLAGKRTGPAAIPAGSAAPASSVRAKEAEPAQPAVPTASPTPTSTLPPTEEPGLLSRMASGTMQSIRHLENTVLTLFGKGDDTIDLKPVLSRINDLEPRMNALSDAQLKGLTSEFRARLKAGETEDDILPEAFAAVREASRRVMGMRPYDVQVLGGIAMHHGQIAEMKTGEGKTLTATLPVYLNALSGKGVHVVTVNETLAKRDSEWNSKLYEFMGLSVGCVTEDMKPDEKRANYNKDVTYLTNVTLGFDYLRDNMTRRAGDVVQREPNFALVDEVDEVLIDEARTPLIISELSQPSTRDYQEMAKVVEQLKPGEDYKVNLKERQTWLTEEGQVKAEKLLGIDNMYSEQDMHKVHYLRAALIAKNLFVKDKDYVVNDGKVDIVDEFTGRIMDGRRYNDGIHQALEAKEGVAVQPEQKTMASITYPNLFRRYHKLAGMSGTAKTEESEFANLYNLGVSVIPPNRPSVRLDQPDMVYKTYQEKFKAIADQVHRDYEEGKPVLLATRNIVINEYLHQMLNARGIPHQLLNAKSVKENTDAENAILAMAGKSGMVTLATNMAGRGVDIKPDYVNFKKLTVETVRNLQQGKSVVVTVPKDANFEDVKMWMGANQLTVAATAPKLSEVQAGGVKLFAPAAAAPGVQSAPPQVQVIVDDRDEKDRSKDLPPLGSGFAVLNGASPDFASGGLHVIGTERHESRRIDNQLKGRAARQGNPGGTQFFVSLDDELMRLFGGDRLKKIFEGLGIKDNQAVSDSMLDKAIESAQKKVEGIHFEIRKNTTKYDQVLNTQRDLFYKDRKEIVEGADLREVALDWAADSVDKILEDLEVTKKRVPAAKGKEIWERVATDLKLDAAATPAALAGGEKVEVAKLREQILDRVKQRFGEQEKALGPDMWKRFLNEMTLDAMDEGWTVHLEDIQELQSGIGLVAYGEQDPWIAYQKRAFEMWQGMKQGVELKVLQDALSASFTQG